MVNLHRHCCLFLNLCLSLTFLAETLKENEEPWAGYELFNFSETYS